MSPFFSFSASERALARLGAIVQQKYRIDRLIGVGGMGAVYAATHRNGHRAAIKFLHEGLWDDAESRRLFSREAYVANEVGHSGAVPVLDDDVDDDGCPFLIMPLLEGTNLRTRWERAAGRRLPVAEVAVVMADALDVLASAHAKGIVHRDIKPDNLFITRDGAVRVLDFGVARRFEVRAAEGSDAGRDADPMSCAGRMVGTPAFMPPEQFLASRGAIGPYTDCWAMGATIFTLLSGELVHGADVSPAQFIAGATTQARSLAELAPDLPLPIVEVVQKALAFDPADRWQSARQMREALLATFKDVFGKPAPAVFACIREQLASDLSPDSDDSHGRATQPAARLPWPAVERDAISETLASPSPKAPPLPSPASPQPAAPLTLREGEMPAPEVHVDSPRPGSLRRRRRRLVRAMLAGLALPGIVALVLVVAMVAGVYEPSMSRRLSAHLPTITPSGDAELTSSRQEALVHLKAGIQDWRDASVQSAEKSFARALELDPGLAAAHLYWAMIPTWMDEETREHHHTASAHRSSLDARDLALLEAYGSAMATPPDLDETVRRLREARKAFPSDWLVLYGLADVQIKRGALPEAIEVLDELLRDNPSLALAWSRKAFALALLDDVRGARDALNACLRASRYGSLCLEELTKLDAHDGQCLDAERTARTLMTLPAPREKWALRLANAIQGRGASPDSVHDVLRGMPQLASPAKRESVRHWNEARFHVLTGNFAAADASLAAWGEAVEGVKYENDHGYLADFQLSFALELGDRPRAIRIANDYLARRDAWLAGTYYDWEIVPLRALYRAGAFSREVFEQRRQDWLSREQQRSQLVALRNEGWVRAYAYSTVTPEDAAQALRVLPDYLPMASFLVRDAEADDWIGYVYLLAGHVEKALPFLRSAARSCQAVQFPFAQTQAQLHLGMALERVGDRAGACKSYRVVVGRWGAEKRSTSAAAARSRALALACAQ